MGDWVQVAFLPELYVCNLRTQSISHKILVRKIDLFAKPWTRVEPILHRVEWFTPRKQPEKRLSFLRRNSASLRSNPAKRGPK